MSLNLLQSNFRTSRQQGVRLEFTLHAEGICYKPALEPLVPCAICGGAHEQIRVAWRKPAGTWGAWTVFRYLGTKHVPDLSLPITIPRLPKGARKLTQQENSDTWHS
jgi:hypothetical protein